MYQRKYKHSAALAAGLTAMLAASVGLAAAPTSPNKFLYGCTIKPKGTNFGSQGTFMRLTRSVDPPTLNDGLLLTEKTGVDRLRQRLVLAFNGAVRMTDGTTQNTWMIQEAGTGKCLRPITYSSTAPVAAKAIFDACGPSTDWALKANGDGTYMLSYDPDRDYTLRILGVSASANTSGTAFWTDKVNSSTNPYEVFRFEIRDCVNMNGQLVSPVP